MCTCLPVTTQTRVTHYNTICVDLENNSLVNYQYLNTRRLHTTIACLCMCNYNSLHPQRLHTTMQCVYIFDNEKRHSHICCMQFPEPTPVAYDNDMCVCVVLPFREPTAVTHYADICAHLKELVPALKPDTHYNCNCIDV